MKLNFIDTEKKNQNYQQMEKTYRIRLYHSSNRRVIKKDFNRRKLYKDYEFKRLILKSTQRNSGVSLKMKRNLSIKLNRFPRNSSMTRIRNRCYMTGRPRGVLRRFKISRISFRHLASSGLLNGVYKSSW